MTENAETLRRQAKLIASSEKGPKAVWSDLQHWAARKGPVALKLAVMEFISCQGNSPEAVLVIPQLIKTSPFTPAERKRLLEFAKANSIQNSLSVSPKLKMPSEKLSLSFKKEQPESNNPLGNLHLVKPTDDYNSFRDIHLMMHEKNKITLERPTPGAFEIPRFDSSKSPDSLFVSAVSHKGEHLVRRLVENVRSHGRDPQFPVSGISGTVKRKKVKAKPSKKKKVVAKTRKSAKKPMKKKRKR